MRSPARIRATWPQLKPSPHATSIFKIGRAKSRSEMAFLPLDGEHLHRERGEDREEQIPHDARGQPNSDDRHRAGEVERIARKGEWAVDDEVIRRAIRPHGRSRAP